jgi:hypothetical protein
LFNIGVLDLRVRRPLESVTILPVEFLPDAQDLQLWSFLNLKYTDFEKDKIVFLREAPEVEGLRTSIGVVANFIC